MKRYIIVTRHNGYCGCDSTEYYIFPEETTDSEIDEYIEEGMYDYSESYEYLVTGWGEDWESEDDREEYYDNCGFDWHEADEEEREEYKKEWFSVQQFSPKGEIFIPTLWSYHRTIQFNYE